MTNLSKSLLLAGLFSCSVFNLTGCGSAGPDANLSSTTVVTGNLVDQNGNVLTTNEIPLQDPAFTPNLSARELSQAKVIGSYERTNADGQVTAICTVYKLADGTFKTICQSVG